jgi:peptidyl-prolyl cis-trans isomerase B (cyclophilin B)
MARKLLVGLLIGILLVSTGLLNLSCDTSPKIMQWNSPPAMTIDVNKKYTATIVTEKGNLVLDLYAKDAPITVNNFVFLARQGYYDGCTFHRVIPGFVAQGGDPTGTGYGGPGYTIPDEITSLRHVAGALSMANSGPNTGGSQFFICYADQPSLDGSYSVFGMLVGGWDTFIKLTARDPDNFPLFKGDKIITITITEE